MSRLRGRAAFHLSIDKLNTCLSLHAELLNGAQIGRKDQMVFSRHASIETADGLFKGSLRVILGSNPTRKYLRSLEATIGHVVCGNAKITLARGRLEVELPASDSDRKTWIMARSGNRYVVISCWVDLDDNTIGDMEVGLPAGAIAHIEISAIFQAET